MKSRNRERGQAILEMAVILPVFVFIGLGLADMQWSLGKVANLEFVANETARCQAIASKACDAATPGVNPKQYAETLASNLRMKPPQFVFISADCNPDAGVCTAVLSYHYHPLGVYFPDLTIQRTGTAAIPK